jgi:hypothetical protein
MYLARFSNDAGDFLTGAFRWPMAKSGFLPSPWTKLLLAQTDIDFAVRVDLGTGSAPAFLMLLTAKLEAETKLRELGESLLKSYKPTGLVTPSSSSEFDELTGQIPSWQMRVNYDGYQHDGEPLACDFRLYPMLAGCLDASPMIYQFHLRSYAPDAESERRVRKYLAWLDIKKPFSEPVREMQRMLARRLLHRGSIAAEYLAVPDRESLEKCLTKIQRHFGETTGRIGFTEAPLEAGDFSDALISGRHPDRDATGAPNIPCEGAALYGEQERSLFLATKFSVAGDAACPVDGEDAAKPDVFISYASSDFAYASSICEHLEENGWHCWIAPRDINRSTLSYPEAINLALTQTRAVVVLVSDTANLSVHIPRELDLALARRLYIVPVRLQDVVPGGQLTYLLATCQWLNAYNRDLPDAMQELLTRLRAFQREGL